MERPELLGKWDTKQPVMPFLKDSRGITDDLTMTTASDDLTVTAASDDLNLVSSPTSSAAALCISSYDHTSSNVSYLSTNYGAIVDA